MKYLLCISTVNLAWGCNHDQATGGRTDYFQFWSHPPGILYRLLTSQSLNEITHPSHSEIFSEENLKCNTLPGEVLFIYIHIKVQPIF